MKERLFTIPVNEAFEAEDECPFCFLERKNEQEMLDFVLGSAASYMESDVREKTDQKGFCRQHFQLMFQYGNTLGNAWILKTHYAYMTEEMKKITKGTSTAGNAKGMFKKKYQGNDRMETWIKEKENSCYFCDGLEEIRRRYLETFFMMYQKDASFREKVANSKGFCLMHTQQLLAASYEQLGEKQQEEFRQQLLELTQQGMDRLQDEISWLVDKFDYRNKEADWKNSKDALQRGMQKLWGGYPADPVYRQNK